MHSSQQRSFLVGTDAWVVREERKDPPLGPALIFESEKIARRVHEYPANWRELADKDLFAVSWGR